jgi:hypothetical protein
VGTVPTTATHEGMSAHDLQVKIDAASLAYQQHGGFIHQLFPRKYGLRHKVVELITGHACAEHMEQDEVWW